MNSKAYHETADRALARASYDPRRLVLIHMGVTCLLSALLLLLDFLLEKGIGSTASGLSGMGSRAVLSTVQSLLQSLQMAFLPFWSVGYTYATLQILRGQEARPRCLLQGFRIFLPVLTSTLLMLLTCIGVLMLVSIVSVQLLSFTPLGANLLSAAEPLLASGMAQMDEAALLAVYDAVLPISMISFAVSALALFVFSYRFRLLYFTVCDDAQYGGRIALFTSRKLMQGCKMELFRLDLHFWWYYLILALLTVLAYGDMFLSMVGIQLPWSGSVSAAVFYVLYVLGTLAVSVLAKNTVSVAYAAFYQEKRRQFQEKMQEMNPFSPR